MQSSRWAQVAAAAPPPPQTSEPATSNPEPAPPIAPAVDVQVPVPSNLSEPSMDEFAQTRPPDDLFDDDFVPMAEPVVETEPQVATAPPVRESHAAPRGGRGGRRGGRGNAPQGAGGHNNIHTARRDQGASKPDVTTAPRDAESGEPALPPGQAAPPQDAPQGPARMREKAVQGDRSGTGGVKKAKLTEEELAARLEAMKIKSSQLEAAHARSTADAASFEARELHAAQRRREDRQNRQQMMGEREKNRQRKLQALGGREWDAEKREEDFAPDYRGARRGAHGGIGGSRYAVEARDTAEDAEQTRDFGEQRGRGRGRGGRGRGRGDRAFTSERKQGPQSPPNASDFPELPMAAADTGGASEAPAPLDFPIKGASGKKLGASMVPAQAEHIKSWADQVEGATTP